MKLLLKSKVLHLAIALLALFVPLMLVFTPLQLYLLIGSVLLCTSVTVIYAYLPVIRYTLRTNIRHIDKTEVLTIGILLLFTATALREFYVTFWREIFPLAAQRHEDYFYPLSFFRYVGVVASILALCARRMVLGPAQLRKVPGWPAAILSVGIGLAIGAVMILR